VLEEQSVVAWPLEYLAKEDGREAFAKSTSNDKKDSNWLTLVKDLLESSLADLFASRVPAVVSGTVSELHTIPFITRQSTVKEG
jgi:hypothetical protein